MAREGRTRGCEHSVGRGSMISFCNEHPIETLHFTSNVPISKSHKNPNKKTKEFSTENETSSTTEQHRDVIQITWIKSGNPVENPPHHISNSTPHRAHYFPHLHPLFYRKRGGGVRLRVKYR